MATRIAATGCALLLVIGAAACSKPKSHAPDNTSAVSGDAGHASATAQAGAGEKEPKLCQHQVPADQCTKCNPELVEVFKEMDDWCAEHGLPKSHDRKCDPKLTFTVTAPADWCKDHGLPESKCTKCNPKLVSKFIEAGDYCREHGYPASVCPIHHPELVKAAGQKPPSEAELTMKVRLASAETAKEAGIQTHKVEKKSFARTLEVVGQLEFNRNRLAQLSARGDALVIDVKVDLGDEVKKGQPLVALASATVGAGQAQLSAARARLSSAQAGLDREKALAEKGISPKRSVQEAETEFAAAQADFDAAGASLGAAGAGSSGAGGQYVLLSPFAGTVVARDAVVGRSATAGEILIQVADLSTMWAQLDVPESDAAAVKAGQKVTLTFEGAGGTQRAATITRMGNSVDADTRTVHARVELPNPDRALKAGSFLRAKIQIGSEHEAVMVPRDAIQRAENRTLVFVKKEPGLFEPVAVELGATAGDSVEVVKGLSPGAEVVTTGAFLLKTEILKDSIGAGCCDEEGEK